jgi:hypothetical protein
LLALLSPLISARPVQALFAVPQPGLQTPSLSGGTLNTDDLLFNPTGANDIMTGMSLTGLYSFNATRTEALFSYTAVELVTPSLFFAYTVDSNILGYFSTNDPNSTASVSSYQESSTLDSAVPYGSGGTLILGPEVPGAESTATLTASPVLPVYPSSLSLSSSASSPPTFLGGTPSDWLYQSVTVLVDGLDPSYNDSQGELITMDFPNNSGINPATAAPEPASLTLLGLGSLGLIGYGRRRRRG